MHHLQFFCVVEQQKNWARWGTSAGGARRSECTLASAAVEVVGARVQRRVNVDKGESKKGPVARGFNDALRS
jgi:hypothetical protein